MVSAQALVSAGKFEESMLDGLFDYLHKNKLTDPATLVNMGMRRERL